MKTCTSCGEKKQKSKFNKRKGMKDGLTLKCTECINGYYRALWAKKHQRKPSPKKESYTSAKCIFCSTTYKKTSHIPYCKSHDFAFINNFTFLPNAKNSNKTS